MNSPAAREEGLPRWNLFVGFLQQELAPYPGRWAVVARMVISAVLCMIIIVTLRIPYGAPGIICAFLLSRENLSSTAKSGFYFLVAYAIWIVMMPVGARMFASVPLTHFLWEAVTAFMCFFFLKTFTYFPLATGLVVVATTTMGIWYLPGPAEQNVELTLWQIPSTGVGILITLAVEAIFRYFAPRPSVVLAVADQLQSIDDMLDCYCRDQQVSAAVIASITQYAVTGTSLLRAWASEDSSYGRGGTRELMLAALVGRSIDISAALVSRPPGPLSVFRERAELLRFRISRLRNGLLTGSVTSDQKPDTVNRSSSLFSELEATVRLMEAVEASDVPQAFEVAVLKRSAPPVQLIVKDTFSNPDYIKFALAGTAASMLCYMIYVSLSWPGISTAVTTCALTALTDTGSSRRKQLLRITGASIGGFIFGVGSQIFILPYIDSIVGLIILFTCVTAISAYVATSSPKLSYAGLQMALAFYLINFMDFTIPLDLTIGRDRAIGILLGIGAMWLVFERLYPRPAAVLMIRQFAKAARLVASLETAGATSSEFARVYALRDQFGSLLSSIKTEAEAINYERGERHLADLAARSRIQGWAPVLQTLFLLQLPMMPFPASDKSDQTTPQELRAYDALLERVSTALIDIANHLETQLRIKFIDQQLESSRVNAKSDEVSFGRSAVLVGGQPVTEPFATLLMLSSELRDDVFRVPVFDC